MRFAGEQQRSTHAHQASEARQCQLTTGMLETTLLNDKLTCVETFGALASQARVRYQ